MLKNGLLVVLTVFSFAMVAKAENQLESTENKTKAEDAKKLRPFSIINEKTKQEEIYQLTEAQAKSLPSEKDESKYTDEQKKAVKKVIDELLASKQEPKKVALAANEKDATTACYAYYGNGYVYGYGGGYYNGGYYNAGYYNGGYYNSAYYGGAYYGGAYYGGGYVAVGGYGYTTGYYNAYNGGGCYYNNGYYGAAWGYRGYYGGYYGRRCYW